MGLLRNFLDHVQTCYFYLLLFCVFLFFLCLVSVLRWYYIVVRHRMSKLLGLQESQVCSLTFLNASYF